MEAAKKAPELAQRAGMVKQIIGSGNAITGMGADIKLNAAKALSALGVKSAGNAAADTETLATTLAAKAAPRAKPPRALKAMSTRLTAPSLPVLHLLITRVLPP